LYRNSGRYSVYGTNEPKIFVLADHGDSEIRRTPFYIQPIPVSKTADSFERFDSSIDTESPLTVADKLKWHRLRCGLYQSEAAQALGVNRTTYSRYEEGDIEAYPLDKLEIAAELFGVDIAELLDDYNLFLYRGQGRRIREIRKAAGLTQKQLAALLGVSVTTVKCWEREEKRMRRGTFLRLMEIERQRKE
jgi:transcriptional regulator with XRE-family HTH domain